MIFRAAALSLALFIGIGAIFSLTTNYAEAGAPNSKNSKKKYRKYKKFSKQWWRAYRKQLRREKALNARKRLLRLRLVRLAYNENVPTQPADEKVANAAPTIQTSGLFILVEGKIKNVISGDTFTVVSNDGKYYLVRMLGADAPEINQEFGEISQKNLSNLILGKQATVVLRKKDSFGLYVGTVYYGGEDINLKQIEMGMASYFHQNGFEPKEGDRKIYEQAEQNARNLAKGLWRKQKSNKAIAMVR